MIKYLLSPRLFLFCFILVVIFPSCKEPVANDIQKSPQNNIEKIKADNDWLQIGTPEVIDSSEYLMYPLIKERADDREYNSMGSGSSSTNYWNIIFYNARTHQYHLLDNNKMIIKAEKMGLYALDDGTIKKGVATKFIFYDVTINDYNKDGNLDSDDPTYLFVSDLSGNNFRRISPDGLNVINWQIVGGTNQVLIKTNQDTNKDQKFTDEDESTPYIYDLANGGKALKVFDETFKSKTKKLFEKQWYKPEN